MSNQSTSWRLEIQLSNNHIPLLVLLEVGHALVHQVRTQGGRARCIKTTTSVIVEQIGMRRTEGETLFEGFTTAMSRNYPSFQYSFQEFQTPSVDLDAPMIMQGEYEDTKLSKKMLFSLPRGAIIVSKLTTGRQPTEIQPIFAIRLGIQSNRQLEWEAAVTHGAAQKTCVILWTDDDVHSCFGINVGDSDIFVADRSANG